MKPNRFPSMSFRDPGYGAAAGFAPDPADPTLWGWWDADEHVMASSPGCGVVRWGDHSDHTADKTLDSGRNLGAPGIVGHELPAYSAHNTAGNMLRWSEDVNPWTFSAGCVANDATHVTYSAQNAFFAMPMYTASRIWAPYGGTHTITAKLRNITGNTNLTWTLGGVDYAVTIDAVLTKYSQDFTAPVFPGADLYYGLKDANGAGWGQIECTEFQIRPKNATVTWPDIYVATTNSPTFPRRNGHDVIGTYGISDFHHSAIGGGNGVTNPCTFYMVMCPWHWETNATHMWTIYGGTNYNLIFHNLGGDLRVYTGGGATGAIALSAPNIPTSFEFCILTLVVNGASSLIGFNSVEQAGTLTALDANGYFRGLNSDETSGGGGHELWGEIIGFTVAHDAPTRALYRDYLANKWNITI